MKFKKIVFAFLIFVMVSTTSVYASVDTLGRDGYKATHLDKFDDYVIVEGIDISEWQDSADFEKIKASGIDFVIIRAGFSGYGYGKKNEDSNFGKFIKAAKSAGLMVGVYYFSQAISDDEAIAEAEFTIEILENNDIKPNDLQLPVFFDLEFAGENDGGRLYTNGLTSATSENREKLTSFTKNFCETIEKAGYKAGCYGGTEFLERHMNMSEIADKYMVWNAQYYTYTQYEGIFDIWQYGSGGSITSISGDCDIDFWYLNPKVLKTSNKSISSASIELTGSNVLSKDTVKKVSGAKRYEPKVIVKDGTTVLKEGADYVVGYVANTSDNAPYVVVFGRGEYSDYKMFRFNVKESIPVDPTSSDGKYNFGAYITGVSPNTTFEEFKKKLPDKEGYTLRYKDKGGAEITAKNQLITTGTRVELLKNGEVESTSVVVIRGDLNSDGKITQSDLVKMRKHLLEITILKGAEAEALDVNKDGKVSQPDLVKMRKHILDISYIEQ